MGTKRLLIFFISIASFLRISNGCQIGGGINLGPVPHHETIYDTFRGVIRSEATTNIESIASINFGGGIVGPQPYLVITHENSQFVIQTSSAFDQYEELETALSFSVTINFACTGGTTSPLILMVHITDTNNNDPEFIPTNEFEFVVTPPLPPGFLVTGCLNEITVKDIDLTTSSIIFEIEDNPYFEIEYDAAASDSAVAKEFKAQLKTSTFIRTLREPITLRITATDVDETGDDPRSTSGTVRILGDTEFEFPEELVFSQTFYFASYTDDHRLIQLETIYLQQGFDANVNFTLEGEYNSYFTANPNGNQVSIVVSTPLPIDVLEEKQIYLIVRADREYTSGDSATIVINLPEEIPLLFESAFYEGSIVDNTLQLSSLVLSEGYEGVTVSAEVVGEHSMSFTAVVQGNLVTLTMTPLTDDIIDVNNFILLQVVASTNRSQASTIVNLAIIKDDNITPAFDKSIYTGSYDPVNGLTVEQIAFVQGFDGTVSVDLLGEHQSLFQINELGPIIRLTSSTIPPELFVEQRITLSIEASKPRTVGANAAVIINLPAARELVFEEPTYRGTIQDNELILQAISLRDGYDQNVRFSHSGEYSTYFDVTNVQNQVTITLLGPLPDSVITQNTVIMLTLTASGINAVTTTTSVLLEIIKDDTTSPVLSQKIYYGTYGGPSNFEIENIFLTQGFDSDVSFRLDDSAHAQYFDISNSGNSVTITLRSAVPEDVIFNEKVLLFNVIADKALTVGSNAAVLIRFPAELTESAVMRFSQNYYIGAFQHNEITLENVILGTGYATGTEFVLSGDYAEHFDISNTNNVVQISSNDTNTLPPEVVEDNDFIILTVEARRQRAVSVWTSLVVDIIKEEIVYPVFNQAYYRGSYTTENKLHFEENINLSEGYDGTVQFDLEGDQATWFSVDQDNNSVTLVLKSPIPDAVLENNNQLLFTILALKTNGFSGRAVISIDLLKGNDVRFSQDYYKGYIEDGIPTLDGLSIQNFSIPGDAIPTLSGDYSDYFQVRNQDGDLQLELRNPIPNEILDENNLLILTLAIQNGNNRVSTVIVLEIIRNETEEQVLTFERTYYVGSYNESQGLKLNDEIKINNDNFDIVLFDLEGDDAQWFGLIREENSVKLYLTNPIPSTVLLNSHHLIFEVTAGTPSNITARATVVISLTEQNAETVILGFDRVSYLGSIENNQAAIPPITLSEGYVPGVLFELHGELENYFSISSSGATVTIALQAPIPEQLIPANQIIILQIRASVLQAIPAYATVVLDYVIEGDANVAVELIFAQAYYTGSYTDTVGAGLTFPTPVSLSKGYDANVQFALEGDNAQWFTLDGSENSQTLVLSSPIPAAVLANNQQLVFVINAQRLGSTTARATIVISLTAEYIEGSVLGFDHVTYLGSIENNQAAIPPITLSEGYVPGVLFELHGELENYFSISSQGATVTIALQAPIPEQLIPANQIIILQIRASVLQAIPAYATVVVDYVMEGDVNVVPELIFAQAYYTGSYTDTVGEGLTFTMPISLSVGYDANVQFALEGDNAQWFTLNGSENSQTLVLTSPIPAAVLANNQQLVFVINAQRPGSTTARATIVISLTAEYIEGSVLGFDHVTYLGSIENNQAAIPPITLSEGYVPGVLFKLHGELENFFSISSQGATVTIALQAPIPEQLIPANQIIILQIRASVLQAIPAYATVVVDYVMEGDVNVMQELIFAQAYYTGSYTDTVGEGLTFTTPISLSEGYNANVQFSLEGDNAQWFTLDGSENLQTLVLSSPIPAAVLANNQQLVFVVNAQRPGSTTARATIVISLTAEYIEGLVLGFDHVTYLGSIENNQAAIPPITLSEGYVPGVLFELHGELENFFSISSQGATVTIALQAPIPEQSIPANQIIILQIRASVLQAIPAYATVVIDYVMEGDVNVAEELIFAQAYYTGSYTDTVGAGLTFTTPISLSKGYDANVQFALEGDNAQWFTLDGSENSQTLVLSSPIPAAVLANNQQLVFVVNAQRPGSTTARATIVISLTAEYIEGSVLGFDHVTYLGSIENNQAAIPPITLSEGYVPGVLFELHGELENFFSISSQGATVTIALQAPIPEQLIPANQIIILQIRASVLQAISAYATVVVDYVMEGDVNVMQELIFAQAYYTGSYTDTVGEGLTFTTPISLSEGYNANVQFALEGDNAQWFTLDGSENSQTLVLSSPIPAAVLANNQQLVFVINAQRLGSTTARATIVISLTAEYIEGSVLGFDHVTYLGSIENNQAAIPPITLSEGYVPGVLFELHGELENYFSISSQGATVTIALQAPIPEQLIPANQIIILQIRASVLQAIPAYATVVVDYVMEGDVNVVPELIFAQAYYTGSYTDTVGEGLTFTMPISLSVGYDANVQFALEGDNAQWFTLNGSENSQTLVLTSPIPAAVLANNQQLVFVINAQRPGSTTARATIVISLTAEYIEGSVLGFDHVTYLGSIENNQAAIPPITLSEGYVPGVLFKLHGELENFFSISSQGATVTIALQAPIPEQLIPANQIIILQIRASVLQAIPAYATVVVDYVMEGDVNVMQELIFAQAYYTGSYTDTVGEGLTFTTPISLSEGYNANVQFSLEGDNAQWFTLDGSENLQTLVLSSPIPAAVLANNQQLVFVVNAQRPGSTTARATIVISLTAEYIEGLVLGFDHVTYLGSIENNQAAIPPITLSEGYVPGVLFELHGELENFFSISSQGATVTIALQAPIPEQSIPANQIIILQIRASVLQAIPAYATVVIDYVMEGDVNVAEELIFAQAYYTGSYTDTVGAGLTFTTPISLSKGYDANVQFALEGDNAQWFTLDGSENSQTLVLSSPIPAAVLANNQQLVFVVNAQRPGSTTARATIVISLTAEYIEGSVLGFDHVTYLGSIENNQAAIPPITLSEGYVPGVLFELHGELENFFSISSQGATVTIALQAPIPEQLIPANQIIILQIRASVLQAIPAYATVVVDYVMEGDVNVMQELIFAQAYYTGSYTDTVGEGLTFTTPISLSEGYNANVQFALEGDNAQWFTLDGSENSQTLVLSSPIPAAVLANNQQLVFVVNAQRPGSTTARATIVISLTAEYIEGSVLGFDHVTYLGSIENNQAAIPPITLSEGYVPGVLFELHGELENFFSISSQGATVTIALQAPIPEQLIPANQIIILQIRASVLQAIPAYATVVVDYVMEGDVNVMQELIFAQAYYTGSYTDTVGEGLTFTTPISLSEGYNANVQFSLEGDNAQWFTLDGSENLQTLVLSSPIPAAVLANNQQLLFVINAQRPGSTTARATIVISLTAEYTEGSVLGFDRVTYLGSIENNQAAIPPITLSEGYVPGVLFELHGELENYFSISSQGATVTIALQAPIPEQSIPANQIIILQIRASVLQAIPAYATVVLDYVMEGDVIVAEDLYFAQVYYTGSYTDTVGAGLTFTTPISLSEGYDANVQFALEGDNAQWFTLDGSENSQTLVLSSPIPAAVLANNQQLVFVVNAQRPGSTTARATIVISLTAEYIEGSVLGFDHVTYLGSIENNQAAIPPITLSEGYVPGVLFELHGELENFFSISSQGATVTIALQAPIPEQLIPANQIIILQIRASVLQAIPAYATVVVYYVMEGDFNVMQELIFAQAYYTGSYTDTVGEGLTFMTPISLSEGYNANVQFSLEGDNAQWFTLDGSENLQTLVLSSPIPAAVLANNQQLVFVINAQRPGSTTARATIVISLTAEYTEGSVLGFDRVTYLGFIENNQAAIPPITLSEGYVPGVLFELHGELENYFSISSQGATVTIALQAPIPEQSIPANQIIILQIRASVLQAIPAYATVVVDYVMEGDVNVMQELIFAQAYYTGSYTDTVGEGLTFTTPISLSEGYDANVQFSLEGDNAQWFTLDGLENSQTLVLSSPIPAAVLANNQQLVFVVNAQRPGSTTARATIVISLTAEYTEGSVLGFDRVTYLGFIENNQAAIPPITLSEGYIPGVLFELHGELENYFSISSQGATVTIALQAPIPEQSIPANQIIILQIRASVLQAIPAYATVVLDYVMEGDVIVVEDLYFAQVYYTGSYTDTVGAGLTFTTPISLSEGYDANVQFALEGDNAQWFTLDGSENSQTLVLSSPIPAAVLANNQQLVFVVNAQRPGSTTARATIVISLTAEYIEGSVLGFDHVTYLGSIENNQAAIPPITLSEGYVPGVLFELHGELENFFSISSQGATVTIALQAPIPEQLIPANQIIILQIRASVLQAIPAYATVVVDYVMEGDVNVMQELIFAQAYYTGSYTDTVGEGLTFTTPISLSEGYDANVQFALEGDNAQWFTLDGLENSQTLVLSSPIPAAVLANNQQLVFVVNAQRPGSTTARATIVISLTAEYTEGSVLGFDRVTYLGSIENNQAAIPPITLSEGYVPGVLFELHGELENFFSISSQGATVTIALQAPIPEQSIPANQIIILQIRASVLQAIPAYATVVVDYVIEGDVNVAEELIFAQAYYTGSYTDTVGAGLTFPTPISLSEGYDANVQFALEGDNAQWFTLDGSENSQTLALSSPIPAAVLANNQQLVFVVNAQRPGSTTARATIVISLTTDSQTGLDVSFDKVIFEGVVQNGVVSHELITINGFSGPSVGLDGEYSSLFEADINNGDVTVKAVGSLTLPTGITHLALELQAGTARAVLILDVNQPDAPTPTPVVTFSSASYAVRVEITDTGRVGQVQASADNGEAVRYSLQLNNAHLQERLVINDGGELHLAAPVNGGLYTFQVVATTIFTQESGTATVHLSAEAITVCGDEIVMPPLIVLDRDEEEPHYNLINISEGCHFSLANRWPLEQTWLYVDETGLHTTAIDREHESIAFMALSQVQVEITLHCETDDTRVKRSLNSESLGPYDYGTSKWVLTDTILYNSRRSMVNLIVNDINDNVPVFVGKEEEPIAVGYPVAELEERVLPRSLAELQATDADIGENAALLYWSSEAALAVAPATGFVHVRDGATLQHDARLTVHATDRNGQGLTGSIDIVVKLLDESNILVVTIRDAFLDDENNILSRLSESVGYEVKVLRSVVISDDEASRKKRDVSRATGASLQLYVYGVIDREPVSIEQLTTDITNAVIAEVNIASTVSLEDHLAGQEICVIPGRDTGLLAATIVLSVLLFIIIVLIAVWFFLRWRRKQNYDQFSDTSSLASRIESVDQFPKPVEVATKHRLNIEELKKSERRLQEMLDAPVQEVTVEPTTTTRKDAILDMPPPPDPNATIVIQSIDKLKDAADSSDDEFGERKSPKRKSVVTFNENVEKIIHVEDTDATEDSENPGYEIYKL